MSFFNQYSAVMTLLVVGVVPIVLLVRRAPAGRRPAALAGGLALLAAIMFLFLQPDPNGAPAAEVQRVLAGNGRPALLELYSDY